MVKILLIRTSRTDQNPKNQIKDTKTLIDGEYKLIEEQQSAFKDNVKREKFEEVKSLIKSGKVTDLYVWDWDRIVRNRKKLKEFFEFCKVHNCKIHSHRQQWFEELHKIPEPFNEMMHDLSLNLMGWMAEDESRKKSERVKASIRIKDGKLISYKGAKWGKPKLSKKVVEEVVALRKTGLTLRQIAERVSYWDKSRNKHQLSKSAVHKIISQVKEENS